MESIRFFILFHNPKSQVFHMAINSLLPFSSYRERPTFFRVVTRIKHSSLSRQTVAFLIEPMNV